MRKWFGGSVSWSIGLLYEGPRRARQCSPAHDWKALHCVTRSLKQQTDRPANRSANHFLMFRIGDCLGYRDGWVCVEILHRQRTESLFNYTTNQALGPLQWSWRRRSNASPTLTESGLVIQLNCWSGFGRKLYFWFLKILKGANKVSKVSRPGMSITHQ